MTPAFLIRYRCDRGHVVRLGLRWYNRLFRWLYGETRGAHHFRRCGLPLRLDARRPLPPVKVCPWCMAEPRGAVWTGMGEQCQAKIQKQFEEGAFLG